MRVDIKSVDIRRAALPNGASPPFGNTPVMLLCPEHKDDSASLAVFPDHIICFGCKFRIQKRLDALAWLLKLNNWKEALYVAEKYKYLPQTQQQKQSKYSRPPTWAEVRAYERVLHEVCEDRMDWLLSRGLEQRTIQQARIGHNGAAFVIPVFDGNYDLITLRYRNDEAITGNFEDVYDEDFEIVKTKKIPKYRGWPGRNDATIYPLWKFEHDRRDVLVLCEGELDALRLWQENVPAITCTNGARQQSNIITILKQYFASIASNPYRRPPIRQVIICGDRDGPGINAARDLFTQARKEYEEVLWMQWPRERGKDITELLINERISFDEARNIYAFDYETFCT
jgi:DNA primase